MHSNPPLMPAVSNIPLIKRATGRTVPDLTGREHVCEYQTRVTICTEPDKPEGENPVGIGCV